VKLVDANILLYAYDSASVHHVACKTWLEDVLNDDEPVGLPWQTTLAFIRISTNPRAVRNPLSASDACAIVASLIERPATVIVDPGEHFWSTFREVIDQARVTGPLVTDAVLAALAIETGATVCSTDRDFRRFAGLTLIDPTELPQ
jgi:uncharacterized protein